MQVNSIAECSRGSKLSFVINIFVFSVFEWPFYTGFTVAYSCDKSLIAESCVLTVFSCQMIRNSYTTGCPPVRGDNPRALASGLSYVQVDKHGITILYHLHKCRPCTSRDISR